MRRSSYPYLFCWDRGITIRPFVNFAVGMFVFLSGLYTANPL